METSEKTAWMSILTNLALVGIKGLVASLTGSLAVTADALHSGTDLISSAIILVGIKISKRTSRRFPYGLYKVENLVALGTSLLILFAAYEIAKVIFFGPPRPLPIHISPAVVGIGATILISWFFSVYELRKGEETGSPSLVADARHIRTDMLSSVVILASLLSSALGLTADRYAALIVLIFIAKSGGVIFLDSVRVLLDASLDLTSLDRIREIVLADARVLHINKIWARNAGRYKFVELDLSLRVNDLEKGHHVSEEIKRRVKNEISRVDRVLIHFQPRQPDQRTIGTPLSPDRHTISEHFGEAPFFRLLTYKIKDGTITAEHILSNPFLHEQKAKGIKVAEWLLVNNLDQLIMRHDQAGKGPGFVLKSGGAEIFISKEVNADKALTIVKNNIRKPDLASMKVPAVSIQPEL